MADIRRLSLSLFCLVMTQAVLPLTVGKETCVAYCDKDRLYVGSQECNGYCCGTHADMYCCVSYWDRVPTPTPNITSPADCVIPDSGATSLLFSHLVTVGIPILITILGRRL